MRFMKKSLSVLLAVITMMSLFVFSASAASAPTFELRTVSQSGKNVVLQLCLTSGGFNSLDITFKTSSKVASVNAIYTSDDLDKYVRELKKSGEMFGESSSATTKKVSLASTGLINKKIAIYEIKLTKKNKDDLLVDDFKAKITECVVGNKSVTSSVKVNYAYGRVELDKHELNLNYKDSATLKATTSYKDGVTWSSSNTKVVTVDSNGNITTKGSGKAVVTASGPDGYVSDSCTVNVSYTWWQWIVVIVLFGWIWY